MTEIISETKVCNLCDKSMKEMFIMGAGFQLVFLGYYTLQSYQTSVNQLMGNLSLCIIYGCFFLGSFVSPLLLKYIARKYLLIIGCSIHALFIFTSIRVFPGLLLSFSALVGIAGSIIWTVYGVVIEKASHKYNLGRNNGIFWGMYISSLVFGNVLASVLLIFTNTTVLFIVLGIISCLGCLIFLGLDYNDPKESIVESPLIGIKTILGFFTEVKMLLFIPLAVYSSFMLPLMYGKYALEIPEQRIGFYFAAYGFTDLVGGFLFGWLSDHTGRIPILVIGYIFNILGIGCASFQESTGNDYYTLGGLILIGIGESSTQTMLASILNRLQKEHIAAAFSWRNVLYAPLTALMYILIVYIPTFWMEIITIIICSLSIICILILDRFVDIGKNKSVQVV
jgi:MFS family permease